MRLRPTSAFLAAAFLVARYRDELRREVQMSNNQLYVSVYRLRKELSAHGLSAEECIEQRKPTRQIRLGIADVTIHQL